MLVVCISVAQGKIKLHVLVLLCVVILSTAQTKWKVYYAKRVDKKNDVRLLTEMVIIKQKDDNTTEQSDDQDLS